MLTPFATLAALEELMLSNARSLPYHERFEQRWVGVSFLSGHKVLLTPLEEVVEIMPIPVLCSVPGVKSWLRGMVTSHGELFPVTDLQGFLTGKMTTLTPSSRILVIQTQEDTAGFLVDRVLGLQRTTFVHQQSDLTQDLSDISDFVIGSSDNEYVNIPIISCKVIMKHPKFRDVVLKENEFSR